MSRLLYGYRRTETGVEPVPEEARVVQEIFEEFLAGTKVQRIAQSLAKRDLRGRRGGLFTSPQVHRILRQATYAGADEGCPALVSQAVFDAAQEKLDSPERQSFERGQPPAHLLTGIARCGVCGAGMKRSSRGSRQPDTYACPSLDRSTPHPAREMAFVDELVTETLFYMINTDHFAEVLGAAVEKRARQKALLGRAPDSPLIDLAEATDPRQAWEDRPLEWKRSLLKDTFRITILTVPKEKKGRHNGLDPQFVDIRWAEGV